MKKVVFWGADSKPKVLSGVAPVISRYYGRLGFEVASTLEAAIAMSPSVLVAMGGDAVKKLIELGKVPKNRTISSLRGGYFCLEGVETTVTFSPTILEIDYAMYVDMLTDVGIACRVAETGSKFPTLGNYRYTEDLGDMVCKIKEIYAGTGKPVEVALDLETVGLDPYLLPTKNHPGAYIVTIQVSCEEGESDVVYFSSPQDEVKGLKEGSPLREQLEWLLNAPEVSMGGANLKFDLNWLHVRAGLHCTNFKFDTTLVGSLLDENRGNSLNIHTKIYAPELGGYDDDFNQSVDKGRMDLIPKDKLLPYAGGDTDACLRVRKAMKEVLTKDKALTRFYVNILQPAARAFEMVEQGGILIDIDAYNHLEKTLEAELESLCERAKKVLGGRLVAKHQDLSKRGGLNITKASLIEDFMFSPKGLNLKPKMTTEKTGKPSTSLDHIKMFSDVPEAAQFVELLSEYSSAAKTLSTYVVGFKKHIRSDGRFHPSFFLMANSRESIGAGGTTTGRLSARDPAVQTIPVHTKWAKMLNKVFIAPEGHIIVGNDYSQGELRTIACIANEGNMIRAYQDGMDLHALTSGRVAGYTYDEMMELKKTDKEAYSALRQLGKAQNFGLLYGMGAEGFQAYAQLSYGVNLSLQEATEYREIFFNTYPGLVAYHSDVKKFVHKHQYVVSPLGRRRHLPLINSKRQDIRAQAERQAINAIVQSTLSDLMIWAISIAHRRGWFKETPCFTTIHDSKYIYVPEDNYEFYIERELELMQNLPFGDIGWSPQLTFVADAKYGKNMGEMVEYEG